MPSEPSPKQEKSSTNNLRGIVSRGIFIANREEIRKIVLSEHEAKIEGLARFVLKMKTKAERRKWLDAFENRHGLTITEELKARILELARQKQ